MPNDISKLCDSNMDLGYDDNMLNVINGSDETFESLGYFGGYDAALDPYARLLGVVVIEFRLIFLIFFWF